MPYIKQEQRDALNAAVDNLNVAIMSIGTHPGNLNYVVTRLCLGYMPGPGRRSYFDFNEVIGALECAKLELYRRAISKYEDLKAAENGDLYAAEEDSI